MFVVHCWFVGQNFALVIVAVPASTGWASKIPRILGQWQGRVAEKALNVAIPPPKEVGHAGEVRFEVVCQHEINQTNSSDIPLGIVGRDVHAFKACLLPQLRPRLAERLSCSQITLLPPFTCKPFVTISTPLYTAITKPIQMPNASSLFRCSNPSGVRKGGIG